MSENKPSRETGPFRASQLGPDDRYELSDGHAIYCEPNGGRNGRANLSGGEVLDADPSVEEAGIDVGYAPHEKMLRAPDVSVGNVPNTSGWVQGAPPLALEYADTGQDELSLQSKIQELLAHGRKFVWVARLVGPRRVEIYEPDRPMRIATSGDELLAPGILRNPVPVDALFDRQAAHRATFRSLLQRQGYESLDEVRQEGRAEGHAEGRQEGRALSLVAILEARGIAFSDKDRQRILQCSDQATFDRWLRSAATKVSIEDILT